MAGRGFGRGNWPIPGNVEGSPEVSGWWPQWPVWVELEPMIAVTALKQLPPEEPPFAHTSLALLLAEELFFLFSTSASPLPFSIVFLQQEAPIAAYSLRKGSFEHSNPVSSSCNHHNHLYLVKTCAQARSPPSDQAEKLLPSPPPPETDGCGLWR